ncbi:unnamed protein product [Lymnaea stagnalis]|uniref:PIPK domain-containing protein n=1 Tax=Lymnaea stagnalis TaxID=6523 RepID=A0AAV2I0H3_LYMST
MDIQLRYRGQGCAKNTFDQRNLHSILPQALAQSFGIRNSNHISDLPNRQFDVKSYHPYTCRDVRQFCLPNYRDYEKNLSENSFSKTELLKNVTCFLNTNEDFQISVIDKNELSLWTKGAERQQKFFDNYNKKSFLQRTLGLYSYKEHKKKKTYFSVTNNLLPNDLVFTEKYALKASERRSKSTTTLLKDTEFKSNYRNGLIISRDDFNELYAILKQDCEFLNNNNWINYYLSVAIHEVKGQQTIPKLEIGRDALDGRTLQRDSFGIVGQRSHGIKATGNEKKQLLIFIGIRGHLLEYAGIRKLGHSIIKPFQLNTVTCSPSEYKERFLKEFQQKWFKSEDNEETKC